MNLEEFDFDYQKNAIDLTTSSFHSISRSKINQQSFSINSNELSYNTRNALHNGFNFLIL